MEQKNKKAVYVIVAIIILLVGLGAGYMIGKSGKPSGPMGNPPSGFQGQGTANQNNTNGGSNNAQPVNGQQTQQQAPASTNQGQ